MQSTYFFCIRVFFFSGTFLLLLVAEPPPLTKVTRMLASSYAFSVHGDYTVRSGFTRLESLMKAHEERKVWNGGPKTAVVCVFCSYKWAMRKKHIAGVVVLNIFYVHHLPGEMIQVDEHIFQMGWNHQVASCLDCLGYIGYFSMQSYGGIIYNKPL